MILSENNGGEVIRETLEGDQLIFEAVLEDAGVELSESEIYELISEQLLSEKSIIRLDKAAKKAHAKKKAVIVLAREAGDPLYKKLVTVYKQKRKIIARLVQKYGSRADQRVRKNAAAAGKRVTPMVRSAASSAKNQGAIFKGTDLPRGRR